MRADLTWLLAHGFEKGVHVILSTANPQVWGPDKHWQSHFGVRIWGRGSDGVTLHGRGDFLATGAGETEPLRFQAAYVGRRETEQALRTYEDHPLRYRGNPLGDPLTVVWDAEPGLVIV